MTLPNEYRNLCLPVKWFLHSYRALNDAKSGIDHLGGMLQKSTFLFSEWKVVWIGTCALLRTSIHMFQNDMKSCINEKIREQIHAEWNLISKNRNDHQIFWEFLKRERDYVLKQYEWAAYEAWMKDDGTIDQTRRSLLSMLTEDARPVLIMRGGLYDGRNSLDLLKEGADWVEQRIYNAITRAGFKPDESRNAFTFELQDPNDSRSLAGELSRGILDNSPPDDTG